MNIGVRADQLQRIKIALAIVLAIFAVFRTLENLKNDANRAGEFDFCAYYAWALEYADGERLWTPELAHGEIRPGIPRHPSCNYAPFFVMATAPLSRLGPWTAHLLWELIQLMAFVGALAMLARGADQPLDPAATLILISLGLLSRGFRVLLFFGQCSPLLLAALIASWLCSRRRHYATAGLCLAFAALFKLYPGAIGGYYFFRGQWKVLAWAAIFAAAGVLITG